LDGELNSLRL